MGDLADEVHQHCGCSLRTTHGIPCACMIHRRLEVKQDLYLTDLHPYWTTLILGDGVNNPDFISEAAQDSLYFLELVDQVQSSDPPFLRSATWILEDHLRNPGCSAFEPNIVENPKGRPRKNHPSMKCNKSGFEYTSHGSSTRGQQSLDNDDGSSAFLFDKSVPEIINQYIVRWTNVKADGNCGFRSVANDFWSGEKHRSCVPTIMENEIVADPEVYRGVYYDQIKASIKRITRKRGLCTDAHWMVCAQDLFPIAHIFNIVVILVGLGAGGSLYPCIIVLPLESRSAATGPIGELVIAHLGSYQHYIILELAPG
ncbi:uncharacterized protein LOC125493462 [Beta vulgaris subsp. vulgaris]|uniref:uncharacterized protein LOC125493462 n=1 Tax=Beta vulgaris subsp. vulgaris TaxID=3555 RepID=UPI0020375FFF|nr:uncharacterized protein LOC125493462 [Beta vulgaris subsp. vulgaris]